MRLVLTAVLSILGAASVVEAASAQGYRRGPEVDVTGSVGGRAPWNRPSEYDSGSDNDRRPELPYYQQGRGQQTGGPERNRLPYDGFTLFPR